MVDSAVIEGVVPLEPGDLLTMSITELGAMDLTRLVALAHKLSLPIEDIENRTQALTRIVHSAVAVEDDE